eukprot:gene8271-8459_t
MDVQDGVCCEAPDALLKDWFRDNIFQHDSASEDYAAAFLLLDGEQQHASDTAPLLEALREPLDVPLQFVNDQQDDVTQDGSFKSLSSASSSRHQQAGSSGGAIQKRVTADKPRAKNIKRYKSQAQKDAHKRYRERKRQNINAMEAEVREKLQLLQQLEAENQQLKCKYRVLQTSYNLSASMEMALQDKRLAVCAFKGVAVAAEEQLCQLTRMVVGRMQPLLVAHGQGLVYDFNTRNLETMAQQEPPPELWPQVLSLMKLTPQQQEDALACYRMFSICLSKLLDKRIALGAQYKELQQRAEALAAKCKEQGEDAGDVQQRADITAASMEALQSIAKNLAAYQSLDGVFAHSITSIISGAQMAVAMVHRRGKFAPYLYSLQGVCGITAGIVVIMVQP